MKDLDWTVCICLCCKGGEVLAAKSVNRKRNRRPSAKNTKNKRTLIKAAALLVMLVCGYFLFELIRLDILPHFLLIIVVLLCVLLTYYLLRFWVRRARRPITRLFAGILSVALGVAFTIGGMYLRDTEAMFQAVTNMTDKTVNVVTVYAMSNENITKPSELSSKAVGVVSSLDEKGTKGALKLLEEQGAKHVQTVEYPDAFAMVDALYSGLVSAIVLPEQLHDALQEAANDQNKYNALTTFTNVVDQYIYYTPRQENMNNPANKVLNIMRDPFVVLISGNDSYGSLNSVSRSDVNMLVAVNPKTAQVLMISIPRDTYTEITCKKSKSACEAVANQKDKLTHSGLYGVATTESTLEDLLDIPINYTVRVNFSSLINIVDALGGVDVEVEPGLEVDKFYANGTEGVHAGTNHLNGERALAFSRERYAYVDGDNQRVRNQQILMKALMKAVISPAMVVNYPKVMTALSTAFETNMSAQEMKSLVAMEISQHPDWNIQSYAMSNDSSTEYSPSLGDLTAVTIAREDQIEKAHDLIEDVLKGRTVDVEAQPVSPDGQKDMNADLKDPDAQDQTEEEQPMVDSAGNTWYTDYNGNHFYVDPQGNVIYP